MPYITISITSPPTGCHFPPAPASAFLSLSQKVSERGITILKKIKIAIYYSVGILQ